MSSASGLFRYGYALLSTDFLHKLYSSFTGRRPGLNVDGSQAQNGEGSIKNAVKQLLDGMGYHRPKSDEERQSSLRSVLHSDFSGCACDSVWFEIACRHAAMLAEVGYRKHSYEAQLQIARFTWFILYMDDLSDKFPSSMEKLQLSILSSESVDQIVLDKLRTNLCDMYPLWDPLSANCIVSSTMEYINGCLLEGLQISSKAEISPNAQSWPYYLREKTGVAAAYAFMIFPQSSTYSAMDFIQVIGDIMIYINLANDVLSFYKEELAKETGNYIHNKAIVSGKSASETLIDVSRDTLAAYSRVSTVLESQSPIAYELWKTFAYGYISCHVDVPRYRLDELGIR